MGVAHNKGSDKEATDCFHLGLICAGELQIFVS